MATQSGQAAQPEQQGGPAAPAGAAEPPGAAAAAGPARSALGVQAGSSRVEVAERPAAAVGGGTAVLLLLALAVLLLGGCGLIVLGAVVGESGGPGAAAVACVVLGVVVVLAACLLPTGLTVISPGQTSVRQLFGRYVGTVRRTGLVLAPPLTKGTRVSVRVHNFETQELKVNDLDGNPVNIAAIVVWQVADTARAVFAVEDYQAFIATQAESALRHVATTHPYDGTDDAGATGGPGRAVSTLRGGTDEVSAELAQEVAARVAIAGLEVLEVRISSLAYAPEIAQAMLQRQQASAVIAAREQIVEGAVSMVNSALTRLEQEDIVTLDDERRAQMVANLLVVLCSDQRTQPVINAGSLYG